jgi:hypothetical protein
MVLAGVEAFGLGLRSGGLLLFLVDLTIYNVGNRTCV